MKSRVYYEVLGFIAEQPPEVKTAVNGFLERLEAMIKEDQTAAYLAIALIGASVEDEH